MPVSHHVDPARRSVFTTFEGTVTDADLAEHLAALTADGDLDPAYDHLVDARGITELRISTNAVRGATQVNPFSAGARLAVVVSDDAAYGMARMAVALSSRDEGRALITRDLAEARRWLGLE